MATADENTWGGLFLVAPSSDDRIDTDIETISGLGFTILSQDEYAGHTKIFVYGPTASVVEYLQDVDEDYRLDTPGFFFQIPYGEEVTDALVRQWSENDELVAYQ